MADRILYWLAEDDATGKTMVIVPARSVKDAFEAMKVANRYFKIKVENLHCIAGTKKGDKVKGRDSLSKSTNCWMVWR